MTLFLEYNGSTEGINLPLEDVDKHIFEETKRIFGIKHFHVEPFSVLSDGQKICIKDFVCCCDHAPNWSALDNLNIKLATVLGHFDCFGFLLDQEDVYHTVDFLKIAEYATRLNNLRILQHIWHKINFDINLIGIAINCCVFECLEFLFQQSDCNVFDIYDIKIYGTNIQCLDFLIEQGLKPDNIVLDFIIFDIHNECADDFFDNKPNSCKCLDVVKRLLSVDFFTNEQAKNQYIYHKDFATSLSFYPEIKEEYINNISNAISLGNVNIVNKFVEKARALGEEILDIRLTKEAAQQKQFECLEHLINIGCPVDVNVMRMCVLGSNLNMIKIIKDKGVEWDYTISDCAARFNRIEILKYLKDNGCPVTDRTLKLAASNTDTESLYFLLEQGYCWKLSLINSLIENKYFDSVKLLMNYPDQKIEQDSDSDSDSDTGYQREL